MQESGYQRDVSWVGAHRQFGSSSPTVNPEIRIQGGGILSLTVIKFDSRFLIGCRKSRFNKTTNTMKSTHLFAALALPLMLAACDSAKQAANEHIDAAKETATEKMNAGAEKMAEGVKEMKDAAAEKVDAAKADAKVKLDAATESAKEKMSEATDAAKAAAAKALEDGGKAAQDAAEKIKDAAAPQ